MVKKNLVIIGNGMVSYKLCEKMIEKRSTDHYKVIVFGEEPTPAYNRVRLTDYISGSSLEELILAPLSWYQENDIELNVGDPVVEINRDIQIIRSRNGKFVEYDKLVIATGSNPFIPPIKGVDKEGVFLYRTIENLNAIKEFIKSSCSDHLTHQPKAAVIGGGLLGLEAAKALLDADLETHVLEVAPRLMPRQLDESGSGMLKDKLESAGLIIHLNKNVDEFSGNGKVEQIVFKKGPSLDVDIVIISAGIKPRDDLGKKSGLDIAPMGGIKVNEHLKTSDPNIYAIGEVASYNNLTYGLVAPGFEMAEVVASALVGHKMTFDGFDFSCKLKLVGVDVASFGNSIGLNEKYRSITFNNEAKGIYKKILISMDAKYLLGGILIGDTTDYNRLLSTMRNKVILSQNPEELILAKPESILDLNDYAVICACENVTKKGIISAIEEHNITDVQGIKTYTKAGTGCGGCIPVLEELLEATMKMKGKSVKKVLCEHFSYTRQELFHIIKVNKIKKFDELLSKKGNGEGCEICKPAIASMLASAWNEMILNQDVIQDTNDRFLANVQMGGTYSVVPRIQGGEITPDKLTFLGQIAKKYDLYCKITGGQRIDLFGARLDDLPIIWEELIMAGFESGHAYAKGMRTVKSCVGATWCHFGVQDSVSFSIEIENRYKGIRFPHKIKSAVSGCIRECAEAQNKDFGIIATEKGWNLYICGNGGAKPQHAQLLASDLDSKKCLIYIDRFLMYYIKTANFVTRTSAWLHSLEGGMDHLKDVIIDDSLGICDQLENEMQQLVDSYHCEWTEVVKNPEKRKNFKYFVNVSDTDSSLKFIEERGQRIPFLSEKNKSESDKVCCN